MRARSLFIGLVAVTAMVGCKKEKKKPAEEPKPPVEEAKAPPPEPEPPPAKPDMANQMMHCPSAAPGAVTAVKETKTAVVVSVTSKDKAQVAEIQKRAKHLATVDASADAEVKHTGEGTGGGGLGKCPVVMSDVTLKVKDIKTGTEITVTPKDAAKLAEVAKTAKDRAQSMPPAGAEAPKDGGDAKAGDAKAGDAKAADPAKGADAPK